MAIQANELRIGNILNGGIVVESIDDIGINTGSRNSCLFVNANPILLTPEILEKAGFEEFEFHFICHECVRLKVNEIWYKKSAPNVKATVLHYQIKHLHQLQNLYFALTGEELIIKEETPA